MTEREETGRDWPVVRLEHLRPNREAEPSETPYELDPVPETRPAHVVLLGWLSELRRRWKLVLVAAMMVMLPVAGYALLAVPTYTAEGTLQVSSQGSAVNPLLLELADASGSSQVETEVEIIRRREFVLDVIKELRLHLADPAQPVFVTRDLDVALRGQSPVRMELREARAAINTLEVAPTVFGRVPLRLTGLEGDRVAIRIGGPTDAREYEAALGELVQDNALSVEFGSMPVAAGATINLEALSDGDLVETLATKLQVSSVGTVRQSTNLVTIRFTDPDRQTAQAMVQTIMQRYLDQSLQWQTLSASNSAEFIAQRLEDAHKELMDRENTLREFAESERAVQLDTQAQVTIESSADLEAEKRKIELQEQVIGSVLGRLKRKGAGAANLTSNFFDDPVLASNIAALTEAETKYATLRATLTADHPQVIALGQQIQLQQKEIGRLLRSARKNLSQQRAQLDRKLKEAKTSLETYPDKELQLARHMRDVEVGQRLYGFLLEKFQEASILEASTTIDKRIVDAATLPHRKTAPARARLGLIGVLGGLLFAIVAVYLAHLLKRRLDTVEAIKETLPYPHYGTLPAIGEKDGGKRLTPAMVWGDSHGAAAESFRALAVNVSLAPTVPGRGRIIQVTSAQPSEGKSTITANLAVALSTSGAQVLVVDLDLRKPVQHRALGVRRAPGYADLIAQGGGPERAQSLLQRNKDFDVDVLTAGTKLPDTLGAMMSAKLEAMLAYWSERYDYVLLDSPPTFVADTAILGRHADLMLVVARPGIIERGNARHAVESLSRLDVAKGLVLNNVERKHAEYYYGGGYYYGREYAQSHDDDTQAAS